jgi:ubiquinone/menaquinone biosynthesis C-methylase UbiE
MTVMNPDVAWCDRDVRASRLGFVLDHRSEADIARMVELVEPVKTDIVLDMVTGLGHVARAFASHVKRVDALDPDEEMLKEAEGLTPAEMRGNINFIMGDPNSVDIPDKTYNIVAARMALRHLGDGAKFFRESNRVLKPDGKFIIVDTLAPPHPELEDFLKNLMQHNDRSHIRSYTLAEIEMLLERQQFFIDLIEIYPKEHDFETWVRKLGEDNDRARMIELMLQNASDRAKQHFRIIVKNKKVVSFVTWMILIRALPAADSR